MLSSSRFVIVNSRRRRRRRSSFLCQKKITYHRSLDLDGEIDDEIFLDSRVTWKYRTSSKVHYSCFVRS